MLAMSWHGSSSCEGGTSFAVTRRHMASLSTDTHLSMVKPRLRIVQYTKLHPEHVASTVSGRVATRRRFAPTDDNCMEMPNGGKVTRGAPLSIFAWRKSSTSTPMRRSTSGGVAATYACMRISGAPH